MCTRSVIPVRSIVVALAIAAGAGSSSLSGQTIWMDPNRVDQISLEVLHPDLDGVDGLTLTSTAWFASLRRHVDPTFTFVFEVPLAYGNFDDGEVGVPTGNSTTLGNPYAGIEWAPAQSPLFFELGARAPLVSNDFENVGLLVGLLTELPNRSEAFAPDVVPINGWANYVLRTGSGWMMRLRGGPGVWISTSESSETEALAGYSAQYGYQNDSFGVLAGLVGRALLTESGNFDENTVHQIGASANLNLGRWQPGLQFRLPLDDDAGVDYIVGFSIGARLN